MQRMTDLITVDGLQRAAMKIRKNTLVGTDKMKRDDLVEKLQSTPYGSELIATLDAGTYKPRAMVVKRIPKSDGSERLIYVPTVTDRTIQKTLVDALTPMVESRFVEHSYGFRPKRCTYDAVAKASEYVQDGYEACLLIDLQNFFGNIERERLYRLLREFGFPPEVRRLITKMLTARAIDNGKTITAAGVPAGMPIAPMLANTYLHPLDKYLGRLGIPFVRYADDITLFFRTGSEAESFINKFGGTCKPDFGIIINHSKTSIVTEGARSLLGYRIGNDGGITSRPEVVDDLREVLKDQVSGASSLKDLLKKARAVINGKFNYFEKVRDAELLKEQFNVVIDEFRREISDRYSGLEVAEAAGFPLRRIEEVYDTDEDLLSALLPFFDLF